ncbi:ASST-domain-containing protein [Rhodocollybia butyracea]|uniref:ASST-domain-containing protein n=1 Tax=Rhodocollybia butyracea TaxID=206335 RepID=A0A9P5QBS9_9AGAR|nr:ASST-domain-containing protein [Rhodocollybia butyracea]
MQLRKHFLLSFLALSSNVLADLVMFESNDYSSGALGLGPFQTFMSSSSTPAIGNFVVPYNDSTSGQIEDGLILLAPRGTDVNSAGPLIYNKAGSLVWDGTHFGQTLTFKTDTYKGETVILLWTPGTLFGYGVGAGYDLIINNQYEVIANFTADINGTVLADFHEIRMTFNDTALITAYQPIPWDLSAYNITNGWLLESYAQEIDPATGKAIFTWVASDHVNPSLCYATPGASGTAEDNPWDFFHINAINKDDFGNYLISSRHCHSLYYVGSDGNIIWNIGGMNSSVTMNNGTTFAWQHDARFRNNQTQISLFDNEGTAWELDSSNSRGVLLDLDLAKNQVSLNKEWLPYNRTVSESQGNVGILDSGNTIIGWGQVPWFSEYDSNGQLLYVVQFGVGNVQGYRAYSVNWTATPTTRPSVFVQENGFNTTIYTSWNGATEVVTWQLSGSTSESPQLAIPLSNTTKNGFETVIPFNSSSTNYKYYQVAAFNSNEKIIAFSNFTASDGSSQAPAANQTVDSSSNSTTGSATPSSSGGLRSTGSPSPLSSAGGALQNLLRLPSVLVALWIIVALS